MSVEPETVGEVVAASVEQSVDAVIADAIVAADVKTEVAEQIIEGAMQTETVRVVRDLEQEIDECRTSQNELSNLVLEAVSSLATLQGEMTALREMTGSLIQSIQAPPPLPEPSPSVVEDGPLENPEAIETLTAPEPEAVTVELHPVHARRGRRII